MAWARLDDGLMDHPKVFKAGAQLGPNGEAIALGIFAIGLMWSNKHLTDGKLPLPVVKSWRQATNPCVLDVAQALVDAGLWEQNGDGYLIHDFRDYNASAKSINEQRRRDRQRKHHLTLRRGDS